MPLGLAPVQPTVAELLAEGRGEVFYVVAVIAVLGEVDGVLTQEELADAVEVTRQTIISLENGRYNASLLLAHKIAKYFGSSIEEIFLFEEEET